MVVVGFSCHYHHYRNLVSLLSFSGRETRKTKLSAVCMRFKQNIKTNKTKNFFFLPFSPQDFEKFHQVSIYIPEKGLNDYPNLEPNFIFYLNSRIFFYFAVFTGTEFSRNWQVIRKLQFVLFGNVPGAADNSRDDSGAVREDLSRGHAPFSCEALDVFITAWGGDTRASLLRIPFCFVPLCVAALWWRWGAQAGNGGVGKNAGFIRCVLGQVCGLGWAVPLGLCFCICRMAIKTIARLRIEGVIILSVTRYLCYVKLAIVIVIITSYSYTCVRTKGRC